MKNRILNVVIIGAGNIGAFYDTPKSKNILTHAHAFSVHKGFNLIGFVDTDLKKAKQAANLWSVKYFSNIDEAFNSNNIDIVCNTTPDEIHYQILKKILDKKVSFIFTEKPLTKKIKEAQEIIKISKAKKITVMVNYRRRFVPEIINLEKDIKAGLYGKFLTGTGYYGKGILHNGSHLVDMLRFLVDEIVGSQVISKIIDYKKEDPSLSAILKFRNKQNFFLECVDSKIYTVFEIDLLFSKARLRIINSGDEIEKQVIVNDNKFKNYHNIEKGLVIKTSLNKSMYFAADEIFNHLTKGKKLVNSIDEAYKTMLTSIKIHNS